MTATRERIGDLVLRIQTAFLETPALSLTLRDAHRRFDIDEATCASVLGALVDARVLTRGYGAYHRYFPHLAAWRAA